MQKNYPPRNTQNKVCADGEETDGVAHPICKLWGRWSNTDGVPQAGQTLFSRPGTVPGKQGGPAELLSLQPTDPDSSPARGQVELPGDASKPQRHPRWVVAVPGSPAQLTNPGLGRYKDYSGGEVLATETSQAGAGRGRPRLSHLFRICSQGTIGVTHLACPEGCQVHQPSH